MKASPPFILAKSVCFLVLLSPHGSTATSCAQVQGVAGFVLDPRGCCNQPQICDCPVVEANMIVATCTKPCDFCAEGHCVTYYTAAAYAGTYRSTVSFAYTSGPFAPAEIVYGDGCFKINDQDCSCQATQCPEGSVYETGSFTDCSNLGFEATANTCLLPTMGVLPDNILFGITIDTMLTGCADGDPFLTGGNTSSAVMQTVEQEGLEQAAQPSSTSVQDSSSSSSNAQPTRASAYFGFFRSYYYSAMFFTICPYFL